MSLRIEINGLGRKDREVEKLSQTDEPEFVKYDPDIETLRKVAEKQDYENLGVIGNGGSITSFRAFYYLFIDETHKNVRLVTTNDPDYLLRTAKDVRPEDTLVISISKSGETTSVLESTLFFMDREYDVIGVTQAGTPLAELLDSQEMHWQPYPELSGRFSGLAETALFPASVAGLEAGEIREGAEKMYEKLSPSKEFNPAANMAGALKHAEEENHTEVFTGFYSSRMFGFYPLLVQLMHETVCKEGKGQTFFGDLGPEFQHHTVQRIFGGRQNIVPMFITTKNHERSDIFVPEDARNIDLRGRPLGDLDGLELQNGLKAEQSGLEKALEEEEIPYLNVKLTQLNYKAAGELMAFMQYLAYYSARIRNVEPFTQPDVEKSKEYGFEERF